MTILAMDQGTTSSRAVVFSDGLQVQAAAQHEFPQHFPRSGWVEHDPGDIWTSSAGTARAAIEKAGAPRIDAIGITNQRETVVIWDRETGQPVHRAIVWQDRRTADLCDRLRDEGAEDQVTDTTPACCWIPISAPRRSLGCWITWKAPARAPKRAGWPSAPSTAS